MNARTGAVSIFWSMKPLAKSPAGTFSALVGALSLMLVFQLALCGKDTGPSFKVDTTPLERSPQLGTSFAPVVKKVAPSVVNIYSTHIVHMRPYHPFSDDPFFRQFFGPPRRDGDHDITRREEALGSGVIVSPDGYLLTAYHVVEDADEIKVALSDNEDKEYTAKVIGTDPETDVAVLKIEAKDLPAITLGDSSELEVGDVVLALGNPFALGQSVTMGIVSGLGRHYGVNNYEDFIQTDAAINQGNSGGALVDAEGRLVGINTWIATSSGGSEGVGFAVPINMARRVMQSLISGGKVSRGYLGIFNPQDITPELAGEFNLPDQSGALVGDVTTNTPAQKAGLKSGDVITDINGNKITDANTLRLVVSGMAPGTQVTVKFYRDGHVRTVSLALAELPAEADQNGSGGSHPGSNHGKTDALDGVTVSDLDRDARAQSSVPQDVHGAVVVDVDENSNAAQAGLQVNDIIVEINHHPVADANQAVDLCNQATGARLLLKVWRRAGDTAGTRFLSVDNTKAR